MIKNRKIVSLIILSLMLCFTSIVKAQGYEAEVRIPVMVKQNKEALDKAFEVVLEAKDEASKEHLPEETKLTIEKNSKKEFGPIVYEKPGDYEYTISQKPGSEKNSSYDKSVYTVKVFVRNSEDKPGQLEAKLVVNKDESKDKAEEIVFENTYKKPPVVVTPEKPATKPDTSDMGIQVSSLVLAISALLLFALRKKNKEIN
ncbi:MAG: FctA domain-containing protein [Tissierellia bacterium]|nr:FctA domain-containing protein [Tissierellia bacterium]